MKVLLDEKMPRELAGHLAGHECRTVPGEQRFVTVGTGALGRLLVVVYT